MDSPEHSQSLDSVIVNHFSMSVQVRLGTGKTILPQNRAEKWMRPSTNIWQEPSWEPNWTTRSTACRETEDVPLRDESARRPRRSC